MIQFLTRGFDTCHEYSTRLIDNRITLLSTTQIGSLLTDMIHGAVLIKHFYIAYASIHETSVNTDSTGIIMNARISLYQSDI